MDSEFMGSGGGFIEFYWDNPYCVMMVSLTLYKFSQF